MSIIPQWSFFLIRRKEQENNSIVLKSENLGATPQSSQGICKVKTVFIILPKCHLPFFHYLYLHWWYKSKEVSKMLATQHQPVLVVIVFFFFLFFSFFFFFWLCVMACRILVPRPGIEPRSTAVKTPSPNHQTTREREFPVFFIIMHSQEK